MILIIMGQVADSPISIMNLTVYSSAFIHTLGKDDWNGKL